MTRPGSIRRRVLRRVSAPEFCEDIGMRGGTRLWICTLGLSLCAPSVRARADVAPPPLAAAMAARQSEDERKLDEAERAAKTSSK